MYKTIKEKLQSLIAGGFFHIFIGNTLVKMIAFVSSIVIVRLVNKNDYAYLTYADNLYNYAISFAGLGMSSAILKYCATAASKEEDKAYFPLSISVLTFFSSLIQAYSPLDISWAASIRAGISCFLRDTTPSRMNESSSGSI